MLFSPSPYLAAIISRRFSFLLTSEVFFPSVSVDFVVLSLRLPSFLSIDRFSSIYCSSFFLLFMFQRNLFFIRHHPHTIFFFFLLFPQVSLFPFLLLLLTPGANITPLLPSCPSDYDPLVLTLLLQCPDPFQSLSITHFAAFYQAW